MPLIPISSAQYISEAAATTYQPTDMPVHQTGDYIEYVVTYDNTPATALTATAGWTVQDSGANSDALRMAFVYKVAASGSETAPTFTSPVSSNWGARVRVLRGAHATPVDGFAWNNAIAASTTHSSPALTTTNNGCELHYAFAADTGGTQRAYLSPNDLVPDQILSVATTYVLLTGSRRQDTAGAVPVITAKQDQSQGGQSLVIAIRSADGVLNTQAPPEGVNMIRLFSEHEGFASYSAPSAIAASVNGITCYTAAMTGSEAAATGMKLFGRAYSGLGLATLASNQNQWEGVTVTGLSVDATAGPLSISWQVNSTASNRVGNEGAIIVLKSSAGNYKAYSLRRRTEMAANTAYTKVFDATTSTVYASAGTVNLASITEIGIFLHRSPTAIATGNALALAYLAQFTTAKLIGGGPTYELGFSFLANQLPYFYGATQWATALGTYTELKQSVDIGNNSTNTYFNHSAGAFQFPATGKTATSEFDVGTNRLTVALKTTATGTLNLSSSIIKAQNQQTLTIDASAANPGMNTASLSVIGFTPTLKTGFDATGEAFSSCAEIDAKAATYTSCTVKASTNTGGAAMKLDTGASLASCTFTKGAETYALRIPAAGTYSLNETTFGGYTNVINVTAANGAVTINLATGQTAPTYITSGATVSFVYPAATATVPVNVTGAMIEVYNVTTAAVVQRGIVAGSSWSLSYANGATFTAGDSIRIRAVKVTGTTAYEPEEYSVVATATGWSQQVTLVTTKTQAAAYNAWAIDGPAITKFIQDNGNIDIDIGTGTSGTKKEMAAWWYGQLMTVTGIRDFWGAFTIEGQNSIRQNVPVADVLVQNTQAGVSFIFTDNDVRYYRSDYSNPWDTAPSYGSIFADYSGVPLVATASVPTAAAIRTEMDANSTRLAAIDAKTSNLPTDPADQSLLTASIAAIPAAPTAPDIADAVWDEVLTGATHNVATSAGRRLRQLGTRLALEGSVIGTPTTTSVQTDATEATSGFYNDQTFRFTSGALLGQAYPVAGYNGTTKTFTFDEPFTSAPSAADTFEVDSDHVHPVSQIQAGLATSVEVADVSTQVNSAAIVIDSINTRLPSDPADQSLLIAAIGTPMQAGSYTAPDNASITAIKAKTDNLPTDPADQSLLIAAIGTPMQAGSYTAPDNASITAIKAKTDNLPTDPADQSLLMAAIDALPTAVENRTEMDSNSTKLTAILAKATTAAALSAASV